MLRQRLVAHNRKYGLKLIDLDFLDIGPCYATNHNHQPGDVYQQVRALVRLMQELNALDPNFLLWSNSGDWLDLMPKLVWFMRTFVDLPVSAAFSTHLMDARRPEAFFLAWSPKSKVLLGYVWKPSDFPWLGIWEENRRRTSPPWNGRTITRGMEFGVSPMPETRRQMIARGSFLTLRRFAGHLILR